MNAQTDFLTLICKSVNESADQAIYISDADEIEWIKHPNNRRDLIRKGISVCNGRSSGEFLLHVSSMSRDKLVSFMQKTGCEAEKPTSTKVASVQFKEPKRELFVCDCGDINHQFVVTIDDNCGDKDVILEVRLNRYLSFWARLRNAIRYLLKLSPPCRYGDYDCIILNKSHIEGLERVISELKTL